MLGIFLLAVLKLLNQKYLPFGCFSKILFSSGPPLKWSRNRRSAYNEPLVFPAFSESPFKMAFAELTADTGPIRLISFGPQTFLRSFARRRSFGSAGSAARRPSVRDPAIRGRAIIRRAQGELASPSAAILASESPVSLKINSISSK